jgi:hypothetical protein
VILTFGAALPFFLIQVVRRAWYPGPEMLMLGIILCHTAAHVVFTSAVRYRIPIEPLVIILAIQGLRWTVTGLIPAQHSHNNGVLRATSVSQ